MINLTKEQINKLKNMNENNPKYRLQVFNGEDNGKQLLEIFFTEMIDLSEFSGWIQGIQANGKKASVFINSRFGYVLEEV